MQIIFHADDFGITRQQSEKILRYSTACGGKGVLNSTSMLVNSPSFSECVALILPHVESRCIQLGWHANLLEGPCCAHPGEIPLLVNDSGLFNKNFQQLLTLSKGSHANEFERQVKQELSAQLHIFLSAFPFLKNSLRVDSHQHTHMIPQVFDALLAVIREHGCTLSFLRVPVEPLAPFITSPHLWPKIPAVNIAKRAVLASLWHKNRNKLPDYHKVSAVFCGVVLSGRMEYAADQILLDKMRELAQKRKMPLEMLFHPGGIGEEAGFLNPQQTSFNDFYTSKRRDAEGQALETLENMIQ